MDGLEQRVAKIEGVLEQIDKRLGSMDKRFESMDKRFESIDVRLNHLSDEINLLRKELTNKIDSNFKLTIKIMLGILIPMWVSIIGMFVGLFITVAK